MHHRIATSIVLLFGCGGPPAPAPVPIANAAEPAPPADDALCCCTYASADPLDYGVVSTWESLASACVAADADRPQGKCIEWKWCGHAPGEEPRTLADRPHLAPTPPLAKGDCCCDIFDGTGETMHVLAADTCAKTPDAHCVDAGFCEGLGTPFDNSKKRR